MLVSFSFFPVGPSISKRQVLLREFHSKQTAILLWIIPMVPRPLHETLGWPKCCLEEIVQARQWSCRMPSVSGVVALHPDGIERGHCARWDQLWCWRARCFSVVHHRRVLEWRWGSLMEGESKSCCLKEREKTDRECSSAVKLNETSCTMEGNRPLRSLQGDMSSTHL